MIPLRDDIPSQRTPLVNYLVIVICTFAFLAQQTSDDDSMSIIERYALVPVRLTQPDVTPVIEQPVAIQTPFGVQISSQKIPLAPPAVPIWATLITCMFLHGGWMHFIGNMWFLYIFGDNVEDRLGHFGFALLYLGTGILAGLAHLVSDPSSSIPTLGASGAIAGVMGAYALLYPHARVLAVLPILFILTLVIPAPVFLGIWFIMQITNGVGSMAGGAAGGVAWWAHAGGFIAGAIAALLIGRSPLGHAAVTERRF